MADAFDTLTSLHNRHTMSRLLKEEARRSKFYHKSLSFILIDIDGLKHVGDYFGLPAGDYVIREVGHLIARTIRPIDFAGRYAGEEFAVILPLTSPADAHDLGEHLRQVVEAHLFSFKYDHQSEPMQIPVTVSVGVASIPENAATEERLLSAADLALYDAKREGRNCTVLSRKVP